MQVSLEMFSLSKLLAEAWSSCSTWLKVPVAYLHESLIALDIQEEETVVEEEKDAQIPYDELELEDTRGLVVTVTPPQ